MAQRIAMSSTGSLTPTDKQTRYQQSPVCTPRDIAHSPDASGYGRLYAACTGSFKGIKIHNHNAFHDTGSNTFKTANLSNGSYGPSKIAVSRGGVFAMTSSYHGNTHDRVYVYDTEDLSYHTYINFDTSSNSFSSYKLIDIAIYEGRLYVLMQKASGTINYKVAIYHADMTPTLITEFTLKNSTGGNLTSGCNGVNLCNPHSIAADDNHLYVGDYYYVHKFNNCGTYAAGSTAKSWVRRSYGSCSCPAGTRTRSVTCRNAQGAATSGCSGSASTTSSCTCPRYYSCNTNVGAWSYGSNCTSTYSACNSGTGYNGQRICCSYYPGRNCPYYGGSSSSSSSSSSSGIGCFVAGTQVTLADGTKKNIEDIQVEDVLKGSSEDNPVMKRYVIDYKGEVYSMNGSDYFVTPTHPFMTTEGWKSFDPAGTRKESPTLSVSKLEKGDILIKAGGVREVLEEFDSKYMETTVYNFGLNGSRDFYANDYLNHNVDLTPILFPTAEVVFDKEIPHLQ